MTFFQADMTVWGIVIVVMALVVYINHRLYNEVDRLEARLREEMKWRYDLTEKRMDRLGGEIDSTRISAFKRVS